MDELADFVRRQPIRIFSEGQILIHQNEEPQYLYAIRRGFIKIHDISADGNEQLVSIAKKYDFIPLEWIFSESKKSSFFYTAYKETEAYLVNKNEFIAHVKDNNVALNNIIKAITQKNHHLMGHLNAAQKPKARQKIIYMMSYLSDRFGGENDDGKILLPLTHRDIGNLVGLTRETTALELKRLKDEGYIGYEHESFWIYPNKLNGVAL